MASRKGVPNKNRDFLMNRLQEMYGDDFDPIMKMAANAKKMEDLAQEPETLALEPKDKIEMYNKTNQAWDRVAQYTQPKLKAIELSGEVEVNAHEAWLEALSNAAK